MRTVKSCLISAVLILCLGSCNMPASMRSRPSCAYIVTDGKVSSITLKFPYAERVVRNRVEANELVADYEQFLQDLKGARDQLPVVEK